MKPTLEEMQTATADIARQLKETNSVAIGQIERIVQRLGIDKANAFLQEALDIESQGGTMTYDQTRRRTAGGTFFHLVRGRISLKEHKAIWPDHKYPWKRRRKRKKGQGDGQTKIA